jgi:hypothetical protein
MRCSSDTSTDGTGSQPNGYLPKPFTAGAFKTALTPCVGQRGSHEVAFIYQIIPPR